MRSKTFVEGMCSILVREGAMKRDDVADIKHEFKGWSKENFDFFLMDQGLVSRKDILDALSVYFKVPSFDVAGYFFDHSLLDLFPKEKLLSLAAIPRTVDENMMFVVASNPDNPNLLSELGSFSSYDIRLNVGLKQDILDAVEEYCDESPIVEDEF